MWSSQKSWTLCMRLLHNAWKTTWLTILTVYSWRKTIGRKFFIKNRIRNIKLESFLYCKWCKKELRDNELSNNALTFKKICLFSKDRLTTFNKKNSKVKFANCVLFLLWYMKIWKKRTVLSNMTPSQYVFFWKDRLKNKEKGISEKRNY